ncbi:MAG: hypothetical protein AVDCRST_MAG29-2677, partial [uncultured Nocardioidaceae bacterium]
DGPTFGGRGHAARRRLSRGRGARVSGGSVAGAGRHHDPRCRRPFASGRACGRRGLPVRQVLARPVVRRDPQAAAAALTSGV